MVRVRGDRPEAARFEGAPGQKNAYYQVAAVATDTRDKLLTYSKVGLLKSSGSAPLPLPAFDEAEAGPDHNRGAEAVETEPSQK